MKGYTTFDAADYLKDEEVIAEYLTAALEDPNPEVFLLAVRDVARARGMARLPEDHLDFVKRYAKEQGVTVTEVFDRCLRGLSAATGRPGPGVQRMTGILPA